LVGNEVMSLLTRVEMVPTTLDVDGEIVSDSQPNRRLVKSIYVNNTSGFMALTL